MSGNSIGNIFRLTSFGESHGADIGGVIEGCPANVELDFGFIQQQLNRRKPNQSIITSARNDDDKVEYISGIFEGKTLGTPIAFVVKNTDSNPDNYENLKCLYRPSHADYTTQQKYGIRDYRGGGRTSARETIARVVAGAIAQQMLKKLGVEIYAYTSQVGDIKLNKNYKDLDLNIIDNNIIRCPDYDTAQKMIALIEILKNDGDSIGGVISCVIKNVPVGIGEPVFDKLHAELGKAILSINAVKGFEYGSGFENLHKKGSEMNDIFCVENGKVRTKSNNSGGIQGGISNGEDIYFKAAFKPVATIFKEQTTIDINNNETTFTPEGRHDACVLPRAVPIVEAMAAMVVYDYYLLANIHKIK